MATLSDIDEYNKHYDTNFKRLPRKLKKKLRETCSLKNAGIVVTYSDIVTVKF